MIQHVTYNTHTTQYIVQYVSNTHIHVHTHIQNYYRPYTTATHCSTLQHTATHYNNVSNTRNDADRLCAGRSGLDAAQRRENKKLNTFQITTGNTPLHLATWMGKIDAGQNSQMSVCN